MDDATRIKFESVKEDIDRHETYFKNIWERLDRLPRWAVVFGGLLCTLVGTLGSSLLHVLIAK